MAVLLGVQTAWAVALMRTVPATHDEFTYLRAGRVTVEEGWGGERSFFHGPLPLLLTRLVPPPEDDAPPYAETLFRGRMGTLPFLWLATAGACALAHRAGGRRAALLTLLLCATNPLLLGYGALATVDLAQAAGSTLVLWLALRYAERTSLERAAAVGLAVGMTCSLKYLGFLFAPPAVLVVAWLRWRAGRASGEGARQRATSALRAAALTALAALLALHLACGFATPPARPQPELYRSERVRSFVERPVLGELVRLLPQGVASGLDAYYWTWREQPPIFLRGRLAPGHPDYFAWCFALKTPELVLLLAALGGAAALRRPLRDDARDTAPARETAPPPLGRIALSLLALPLLYLSFAHGSQLGIRYALAALPPLLALAGVATRWLPRTRPRLALIGGVGCAALALIDSGTQSPDLLGYFSRASGGPSVAFRSFDGSNCDWGQREAAGLAELRSLEPAGFEVLRRGDGPRFGRVALYVNERATPSPLDPTRSRHWLDAFAPRRSIGAAWTYYELGRTDFERAYALGVDPLAAEDLAIALLGAGADERTRELLDRVRVERRSQLARVLALREELRTQFAPERVFELRSLWLALGRRDLAAELLADPRFDAAPSALRAEVEQLLREGEPASARALLDDLAERRAEALLADPTLLLTLVELTAQAGFYARAVELLAPRLEQLPAELRPPVEQRLAELRALAGQLERGFSPR